MNAERIHTLLFVSGPYSTGDPEENTRRAIEVEAQLIEGGWSVFCPHANTHFAAKILGKQFMGQGINWYEIDNVVLRRCDGIVMLPDWERSKGARAELEIAVKLGLQIFYWSSDREWLTDGGTGNE